MYRKIAKAVYLWIVSFLILSVVPAFAAPSASSATVSNVWVATGARDWNGNGIIDAFEDFNGNGIPDAFEDFNGNGIPDAFESKGPLVSFDTTTLTFGAMEIAVHDNVNPAVRVSGFKTYHGTSFHLNWSAFLAGSPSSAGVIYRVDQDRDRLLQLNDMDGYLDRDVAQGLDVTLTENTCYFVHVAPVRAADASIDRAHETVVRISRETRRPHVRSTTHPVQTEWYAIPNVNLEFLSFHFDGSSVVKYYFVWDNNPDTEPTKASPSVAEHNRAFIFQPDGTYYLHIRAEDLTGSLSETAHFRVNIGEPVPMPPVPNFIADKTNGYAPLTVTFTDLSFGDITSRDWDFDGDGTVDASDPSGPVSYTYEEPGVYTVRLKVTGPGGISEEAKNDLIVAEVLPPAPVAAFSSGSRTGSVPFSVTFTDSSTGTITTREWDFDGNGTVDAVNPESPIQWIYRDRGVYAVSLTVKGPGGTNTLSRPAYVQMLNAAPVVNVATQQIFLANMGEMATLEASSSHDPDGDPLFFSWREDYRNPHHGLIPIGADSLSKLDLYFPSPGRYQFDVQVSDGERVSEETRTITVYVPGRAGIVGYTPSDGLVRVPEARIRVHNSTADAQNNVNPVDVALSDSLGRYVLENVAPVNSTTGKSFWYVVDRPGFTSTDVLTLVVNPDPAFGDSRQDEAIGRGYQSSFSGIIRSAAGAPIENATVSIVPGSGGQVFAASSGTDGRFTLSSVPRGSWMMQLRANGYRPEVRDINVADGMPQLEFTLEPTGQKAALKGKVTLGGTDRPISGVKVTLGTGAELYTDGQGLYEFKDLPVGDYLVTASRAGYEPVRLPVIQVRGGNLSLDIPMRFSAGGPLVLGTVKDSSSGDPVRLATVGIESDGGVLIRSSVSDYTGYYQIRDVPVGMQVFRIEAPGYVTKAFTNRVDNSMIMDVSLVRAAGWKPLKTGLAGRPKAAVAQSFIYLPRLTQQAVLDGRSSIGSGLRYIWRENPSNPVLNLLPANSETLGSITLGGLPLPGIYRFELQVKSGDLISPNTAVITVFAPGLAGNVHASPSDGVFGLNAATVRAYSDYNSARTWGTSHQLDSKQTRDRPVGDFVFDNLTPGSVWLVARAPSGAGGYVQYGPVLRRVNYSTAARAIPVNVARTEYKLSGRITDSVSGLPVENVRIIVAPGSQSESYRTTTDATGNYRLAAVPAGSGQPVMLMKDGYTTRVSFLDISKDLTADMQLTPNASAQTAGLSGVVTAEYKGQQLPVPYAEVIIGSGLHKTFTDGKGAYRIEGLPPGDYYGMIRKEGYIPAGLADVTFVTLIPGENTINKVLSFKDRGPVVRGAVLDANRDPIPGVQIRILPPAGGTFSPSPARALASADPVAASESVGASDFSDAAGVFQMTGVPHGQRDVQVILPNGLTMTATVLVEDQTELILDASGLVPILNVSPDSRLLPASGVQSEQIDVSGTVVGWTAASPDSWIEIISGQSGSGSGTIAFHAGKNEGLERSGRILVSGGGVEAVFTVTQAAAGTVTTYNLTVSGGSGGGFYEYQQQVSVTAHPAPAGRIFDRWTGDTQHVSNVQSATTTVTMPATAVSLTAEYRELLYSLTVFGGSGGGFYEHQQQISITADPAPGGQIFDRWTGDTQHVSDAASAITTVTIPSGPVSLTAEYRVILYTLTATGSGRGQVEPSGEIQVGHGAIQIFTAVSDAGYRVKHWLVGSDIVGEGQDVLSVVAAGDTTVSVVFEAGVTLSHWLVFEGRSQAQRIDESGGKRGEPVILKEALSTVLIVNRDRPGETNAVLVFWGKGGAQAVPVAVSVDDSNRVSVKTDKAQLPAAERNLWSLSIRDDGGKSLLLGTFDGAYRYDKSGVLSRVRQRASLNGTGLVPDEPSSSTGLLRLNQTAGDALNKADGDFPAMAAALRAQIKKFPVGVSAENLSGLLKNAAGE